VCGGQTGKADLPSTQQHQGRHLLMFVLDGVSGLGQFTAARLVAVKEIQYLGSRIEFANLAPGAHTLVIQKSERRVYVEWFRFGESSSNSQPASGPGATTSSTKTKRWPATAEQPAHRTNAPRVSLVRINQQSAINWHDQSVGRALQDARRVNGVASTTAPGTQSGLTWSRRST